MRIVAETVVGILLTLLFTLLVAGLLVAIDSADPAAAFFREGPALVFGAFWIALLIWGLLVILGNVVHRNRRPGARVLHNVLAALLGALVNLIAFAVIGATAGGFGMLLLGIAVIAAVSFLPGAAVGMLLTHLVFFRSAPALTPAGSAAS
jgi:hypothetical protein